MTPEEANLILEDYRHKTSVGGRLVAVRMWNALETIAAQTWEYRVEEWSGEHWYPCETWTDDFSLYDGYAARENERLVRRPVGPVENVDMEGSVT